MQFLEDRVGSGGPLERLRIGVVVDDELISEHRADGSVPNE